MDIERVNIVFNYDMPEDSDTYLHRVARAGRFGTKGLAITFVSDENDAKILNNVQDRFDVNITELPDEIDLSSYSKFHILRIRRMQGFDQVQVKFLPTALTLKFLIAKLILIIFFLQLKDDKRKGPAESSNYNIKQKTFRQFTDWITFF